MSTRDSAARIVQALLLDIETSFRTDAPTGESIRRGEEAYDKLVDFVELGLMVEGMFGQDGHGMAS